MASVGSKDTALPVVKAVEKERPGHASDGEGVWTAPSSRVLLNAGHVALAVGFELQHGEWQGKKESTYKRQIQGKRTDRANERAEWA